MYEKQSNVKLVYPLTAAAWTKKGYDVWLGDQRGSTRSQRHVNLTTDQKKYWDFS